MNNPLKRFSGSKWFFLATPVLMFLSQPSADVFFLKAFPLFAWFAFVPLFHYVRDKSPKDVLFYSFVTGLAGNLMVYWWIGEFGAKVRIPIPVLGMEFPVGFIVILFFLIPALTAYFTLKVWAAEMLSRRFERLRPVIFPAVWICVEGLQTVGFIAYPLPIWGYSQYPFTPFVQMASVTGILGISFMLILSNALAAAAFSAWAGGGSVRGIVRLPEGRRLVAFLAAAAVIVALGGARLLTQKETSGRDMRVLMVQSCISPWDDWTNNRWGYLEELKRYTLLGMDENPDFIIWSESATLEFFSYDFRRGRPNDFQESVYSFVREQDRPLLTGEVGVLEKREGWYVYRYPQNNAVLISPAGEVVSTYAKIHLVPFGEWFPYEKWFPFVKTIATEFGGSSFVPGREKSLFTLLGRRFGGLVCYEGIFHRLCRDYRRLGADMFVNITNDGWTDTYSGHMQHYAAAVFRSVENGVWYLRAGNTGYTAMIDPLGRNRRDIPILKKGFLTGDVDFSMNRSTAYVATGDAVLYLSLAFLAALGGILISGRAGMRWKRESSSS